MFIHTRDIFLVDVSTYLITFGTLRFAENHDFMILYVFFDRWSFWVFTFRHFDTNRVNRRKKTPKTFDHLFLKPVNNNEKWTLRRNIPVTHWNKKRNTINLTWIQNGHVDLEKTIILFSWMCFSTTASIVAVTVLVGAMVENDLEVNTVKHGRLGWELIPLRKLCFEILCTCEWAR